MIIHIGIWCLPAISEPRLDQTMNLFSESNENLGGVGQDSYSIVRPARVVQEPNGIFMNIEEAASAWTKPERENTALTGLERGHAHHLMQQAPANKVLRSQLSEQCTDPTAGTFPVAKLDIMTQYDTRQRRDYVLFRSDRAVDPRSEHCTFALRWQIKKIREKSGARTQTYNKCGIDRLQFPAPETNFIGFMNHRGKGRFCRLG